MSIETDTWPTPRGPWYVAPMAPKAKNLPKTKGVPAPVAKPPERVGPSDPVPASDPLPVKLGEVDVASIAASRATVLGTFFGILVAIVAAVIWIDTRFEGMNATIKTEVGGVEEDVTAMRVEMREQSTRIADLDKRLTRLEQWRDARFGDSLDGGVSDGGSDTPRGRWSAGHVDRLAKHCGALCGSESTCYASCSDAYNGCGINNPYEPPSTAFLACVSQIKATAPALFMRTTGAH